MSRPVASPERRRSIIDALRRGTVPRAGLDALAVGLDRFGPAVDDELAAVARGGAGFKAIRGDYGSGKTFLARWVTERAHQRGLASSEVQVSETETPLHRIETVYRRLIEGLSTREVTGGALRSIVDQWLFVLEEDVLAEGGVDEADTEALLARSDELLEARLAEVSKRAPNFAIALRAYRRAQAAGDNATADGLLAWIGGQPNVAAAAKRAAGVKGDIDHFGALAFLQGLLVVLRDSGHPGLVVVLDEVETLQRVRSDVRDKGLNALRQLVDEVDSGRFPGLYLVVTGTPAFFDGPMGVGRLTPLSQRLATDFTTDARYDNPRAPQLRLRGFDIDGLCEIGRRVRDLYAAGTAGPSSARPDGGALAASERVRARCDDAYVAALARAVSGTLGGRAGVAPRVFLKKLVGDVLDRVDQFPDFDPRADYQLTVTCAELTDIEANAAAADPDDVDLDAVEPGHVEPEK
jgi:hypothetical protein